MIIQWKITFHPVSGHILYADSAYRLYAFLLEQANPQDAAWLHEDGSRSISQYLLFDKEKSCYIWTVNISSEEVYELLSPILDNLSEIIIENQTFSIADKAHCVISAEALIAKGRQSTQNRCTLSFRTPTSFKQSGRYAIFPQEKLILQSLITRWNEAFPEFPLDGEDAFQALLAGIHIVDYQLKSTRFFLKGVKIPSFVGFCVIEAKLALPLLELWTTLAAFADYSGIGIKTGLGMGGASTS